VVPAANAGISAGIYQNPDEIGTAAVQLLISLIHHNQRGIPEIPCSSTRSAARAAVRVRNHPAHRGGG